MSAFLRPVACATIKAIEMRPLECLNKNEWIPLRLIRCLPPCKGGADISLTEDRTRLKAKLKRLLGILN